MPPCHSQGDMPTKESQIFSVDPGFPEHDIIDKAATLIKKGGIIVFPTSTFYGLGTMALKSEAVSRIFQLKRRDPGKPVLILIASMAELAELVQCVPAEATQLIEAFWPGKVTIVFGAGRILSKNLTGDTGKIGIRLAAHPVASALVRAVGSPVTATSANVAGRGGCIEAGKLDQEIRQGVSLVLDAGRLGGGGGSTVVDVTVSPPKILREGIIGAEKIESLFRR